VWLLIGHEKAQKTQNGNEKLCASFASSWLSLSAVALLYALALLAKPSALGFLPVLLGLPLIKEKVKGKEEKEEDVNFKGGQLFTFNFFLRRSLVHPPFAHRHDSASARRQRLHGLADGCGNTAALSAEHFLAGAVERILRS
jgi:hypothetical protein